MSLPAAPLPFRRRLILGAASLAAAAAVWLPCLHLLYAPSPAAIAPRVEALAAHQLDLFRDRSLHAREAGRMRRTNPEWDFMGRTFLAYSLAEMALRDAADASARARHLEALDSIVADTLRLEREEGVYHFLMPYARRAAFRAQPARSQFLDGEIALMLALRRLVAERDDYRPLLAERVAAMVRRMNEGPVLSAESYPDECWTFCNAVALAAIKAADVLDGTDHTPLFRAWVETAKQKLSDPTTGLLVSSYTLDGRTRDGPEGSSIWMSAHMLRAVDPAFADDQYRRARRELGRTVLGFGYAREWPSSRRGEVDVDSGPIVPGLDASGGSSGLAFVAAASFGDTDYLRALRATLDLAAFPMERDGRLRYAASNQVGDAIVLYASVPSRDLHGGSSRSAVVKLDRSRSTSSPGLCPPRSGPPQRGLCPPLRGSPRPARSKPLPWPGACGAPGSVQLDGWRPRSGSPTGRVTAGSQAAAFSGRAMRSVPAST